jgi:hypothetical protein
MNRTSGILVSVFAWNAVFCVVESLSSQIEDFEIGIFCFYAKHALLRSKSKDWLALNEDSVFEWSDMSTH